LAIPWTSLPLQNVCVLEEVVREEGLIMTIFNRIKITNQKDGLGDELVSKYEPHTSHHSHNLGTS
jgi:hypothetical protein